MNGTPYHEIKTIIYQDIFFLLFAFYGTYCLRNNFNEESLFNFLFIIIICISTDIGGYIFGKTFKGPKLINISPNKTYAGVVGSFLFSLIAGFTYLKYLSIYYSNIIKMDQLFVLLYILFISFVSQIGDLIISYFKRKAKLKDTGKLLPGHGGLLDRIDGLIFVLPMIYFLQLIK